MSTQRDYWAECIAIAAEECDLKLTPEQLDCLASSAESGHEHYGMAFYSPPDSDRINDIERQHAAKLQELRDELEKYRGYAETVVKRAYRLPSDAHIYIDRYGAHRVA